MTKHPIPALILSDQFGRQKRKLRVSLTDRCNLRCPYCMPTTPIFAAADSLLTANERLRIISLLISCGIEEIRLTGGEPLLSPSLEDTLASLQQFRAVGLKRVAMTSNGVLLNRHLDTLLSNGMSDINISLDTLDETQMARISRSKARVQTICENILQARDAGMKVKINSVLVRGYNHDQVLPLTEWALRQALPLRFIEYMPLEGGRHWTRDKVVSESEILQTLNQHFGVTKKIANTCASPATYYQIDGAGLIGIIPTVTRPFCSNCDRLRLTATGELFTCLFSDKGGSLRDAIRAGESDADLLGKIISWVHNKPAGYQPDQTPQKIIERPLTMHAMGG